MTPKCLSGLGKWFARIKKRVFSLFIRLVRRKTPPTPAVAPFRLLELPELALRRCLMDPRLFNLAFCSESVYQMVKSMRLPVEEIMVVHNPNDHAVIVLYKTKTENGSVQITLTTRINASYTLADYVELTDGRAADFADLFHIPIRWYGVNPAAVPDFIEYLSPRMEHLQTLLVPESSELSYPQLEFLLEHMAGKRTLIIDCIIPVPVTNEYQIPVYPRTHFAMRHISMHDSRWITEHNFQIGVECESITLNGAAEGTVRAFSKIIKEWQLGKYPKLFWIILKQPQYRIAREEIEQSAEWRDEAPRKFVEWNHSQLVPLDLKYLVLRRHDGMEAIVIFRDDQVAFRMMNF